MVGSSCNRMESRTRKRRRRSMLALSSASSTLLCGAFYPHAQITRRHQAAVVYSAVSNKTIDPESNFWFSVTRTDAAEDQKKSEPALSSKWPVVPSLDIDGPLPPNCYNSFGQEEFQPKPTCALAIAVNLRGPRTKDTFDSDLAVGGMQQFIDHGLTTFHLGGLPSTQVSSVSMDGGDCLWLPSSCQIWGETQVYSMLQKSTPRSVMNSCNLVVPMTLPPVEADRSVVNRVSARKTITDSLRRIGTDSIDTIEVQRELVTVMFLQYFGMPKPFEAPVPDPSFLLGPVCVTFSRLS